LKPGQSIAHNSSGQKRDWQIWFFGPVSVGLVLLVFEIIFQCISYGNVLNKGVAYLKHGDNLMAAVQFNQCVTSNPADARPYLFRAIANQRMEKNDNAIADYTRVIELDPRNAVAYIGRATALEALQQYQLAVASCNSALELDNTNLDAYRIRALASNSAGDATASIKDCNYFLERHPQRDKQRAEVLSTRAMSNLRSKKLDEAIADLTEAISCAPNNGLLYLNRALVYKQMKDYNKAIADCDSAETRSPGELSVFSIRSDCYDKVGNAKAALADLHHLAAMSPTIETRRNRGRARLAHQDYNGALEDFEWILQSAPHDEEANKNRDIALSALKNKIIP
jgi:tetratricopeptide (TPR) repeat protein